MTPMQKAKLSFYKRLFNCSLALTRKSYPNPSEEDLRKIIAKKHKRSSNIQNNTEDKEDTHDKKAT